LGQAKSGSLHQPHSCLSSLASVLRYGAEWPWVEQEEKRLFQITSSAKACRVGGFKKAISLGYFSLGQQREVTRAPAGARKPAAGEHPGGSANVSESPPQASNLAITPTPAKPHRKQATRAANHIPTTHADNTESSKRTRHPGENHTDNPHQSRRSS
jgi:hypothetical protein